MEHDYEYDVCIIGPGRIGLPWAAALSKHDFKVICIDINEEVVESINRGEEPFHEPNMGDYMKEALSKGNLSATTDKSKAGEAKVVGITLNAPEKEMDRYLEIIGEYAKYISVNQVIANRTTLPVEIVEKSKKKIVEEGNIAPSGLKYVTFPERLAEGKAIEEIENLPKIVGTDDEEAIEALKWVTEPFSGELKITDDRTAMFVKLIDNTYRDARFSIANQLAIIAEETGLDAHEAISIANEDYPRNDIPSPGTVGGKCLVKDPHFLMDKRFKEQPETPDLFYHTRKTNREFEKRIIDRIMHHRPDRVAILGTGFKKDEGDEFESPSIKIKEALEEKGVEVGCFDPHVEGRGDLEGTLRGADVALLAVNHSFFVERGQKILEVSDCPVLDVWGCFDKSNPQVERIGSG